MYTPCQNEGPFHASLRSCAAIAFVVGLGGMCMLNTIKDLWQRTLVALGPSIAGWKGATRALWLLWAGLILMLLVTDIWAKGSTSRLIGFGAFVVAMAVISFVTAMALRIISAIRPSYRTAFLFALLPSTLLGLLVGGMPGGLFFALYLILTVSFLFGSWAALRNGQGQLSRIYTFVFLAAGAAMAAGLIYMAMKPVEPLNPTLENYTLEDLTLPLADPGAKGSYAVSTFTYGSGEDRHRPEYAEGVRFKTQAIDGSKLIDDWDKLIGWNRSRYWGFDATELPLQARVWMPEGEGPFPLVLIVHGNHSMEDFSDPGYGYLGEHLASLGYIFVSVDENFLNGSTADMIDPIKGGISEENDARGWMLLEHFKLWQTWAGDPDHPLFGKVDMGSLGVMGHSRGGEAVAVAAAFNNLDYYPDDATLAFDYYFNIGAFIAISPIDGQYHPREDQTRLKDINYFVIHGAMDGDVSSFTGASQYSRIEFSPGSANTKASLYVAGANHGQFNSSWGIYDTGLPYGWLLNTRDIMSVESQEKIARVYFTAFLEAMLNGKKEYLPLFADARYGAAWLPDNYYINNIKRGEAHLLATFDEDLDPGTGGGEGVRIMGARLTKWRESLPNLKWNPLDSMVAVVAWDQKVETEPGEFEVSWSQGFLPLDESMSLIFSASALNEGTKPKDWEAPEESAEAKPDATQDDESEKPLDWSIVATDAAGQTATLKLSDDKPLHPQLKSQTSRLPLFSSNKSSEVVMQRFALPLAGFAKVNDAFDPSTLVSIRFVFDQSPSGVIALDDIGFELTTTSGYSNVLED
ncbi:MAG: hypothetical protein EP347_09285 [Alphaproteobacteria bacterium]|nr:MAG: hypothetical protein EP347_09285 [Alphaproteobacteria bacterium]